MSSGKKFLTIVLFILLLAVVGVAEYVHRNIPYQLSFSIMTSRGLVDSPTTVVKRPEALSDGSLCFSTMRDERICLKTPQYILKRK